MPRGYPSGRMAGLQEPCTPVQSPLITPVRLSRFNAPLPPPRSPAEQWNGRPHKRAVAIEGDRKKHTRRG